MTKKIKHSLWVCWSPPIHSKGPVNVHCVGTETECRFRAERLASHQFEDRKFKDDEEHSYKKQHGEDKDFYEKTEWLKHMSGHIIVAPILIKDAEFVIVGASWVAANEDDLR